MKQLITFLIAIGSLTCLEAKNDCPYHSRKNLPPMPKAHCTQCECPACVIEDEYPCACGQTLMIRRPRSCEHVIIVSPAPQKRQQMVIYPKRPSCGCCQH